MEIKIENMLKIGSDLDGCVIFYEDVEGNQYASLVDGTLITKEEWEQE